MARRKINQRTRARAERMAEALNLREGGATYREIGEKLGISTKRAYDDVQDAIKDIPREPAERVLHLELERIDKLWRRAYIAAMKDGNLQAMDRCMKLMDRRMRLHGLYTQEVNASVEVTEKLASSFTLLDDTSLDDLDPEGMFDQ